MSIRIDKIGTTYNTNILGPHNWTAGSGGVASSGGYVSFDQNGNTGEQNRYLGTDPWGNSAMVWQTVPSGDGNADGGWNTGAFAVDQNKLYRFSVWVRRTSSTSGGTFYFGSQSSTGAVVSLNDRSNNTNPYWAYPAVSTLTQNVWYLFVGHIFPFGFPSTRGHADSGVYTVAGNRVMELNGNTPKDQAWQGSTTTGTHRTYHFYCGDNTTRLEFYDPRVEICNGKEPSVQALLAGPINTNTQAIIYSDGTSQVSSLGFEGQLVDITTFTSTGTWYKPAGVKQVLVKLIGGGGGSAGYNEAGGAGGYAEGMYDVTGVSSVTVTVGGGGAAVTYYAASNDGGTTSFGSYISATGGYGANRNYSHSGGAGGSGSGGSINLQGGGGNGHVNSVGSWPGGRGGQGYFGGSAAFIRNHGNLSSGWLGKVNNGSPGAGGPGALTDGSTTGGNYGGAGESGIVVIYSYK